MRIKSFLLGSAAALVAVGGTQAADAVIVEPEPVEYVRVCDAYGVGFFYIPGTETCLKFSGYVRVTYSSLHYHDEDTTAPLPTHRHRVRYRGRLNVDARNETEWGTLRSQLRFQGGDYGAAYSAEDYFTDGNAIYHGGGDAPTVVDRALISLAGFRLGYSDDYWTTVSGYGYYQAKADGFYSYGQATFFDYTYAADGFTITGGVQVAASASGTPAVVSSTGLAGQPDMYIGATYTGAWGNVFGTYYRDSSTEGGAYKVGVELSLADYISGGAIKGWYMADDGETDYVHGHVWGITAQMKLSDDWLLYAGYSDWDYDASSTICAPGATCTGADMTHWAVGVRWDMVAGLNAKFEYRKVNRYGDYGEGEYYVRVTRSF